MNKINLIVFESLNKINESLNEGRLKNATFETKLYGPDGALDSLAYINLIIELEEQLKNKFKIQVNIEDEKYFKLVKNPFETIESLIRFLKYIIEENTEKAFL